MTDPGLPPEPAADDQPTLIIPRLTRSQRQRASRRRHRLPLGWLAYSLAVVGVILGAALLAVRG